MHLPKIGTRQIAGQVIVRSPSEVAVTRSTPAHCLSYYRANLDLPPQMSRRPMPFHPARATGGTGHIHSPISATLLSLSGALRRPVERLPQVRSMSGAPEAARTVRPSHLQAGRLR